MKLKDYCTVDKNYFSNLGVRLPSPCGLLNYIDNGSNVLAIAHLDHVADNKRYKQYKNKTGQYIVENGALDDRLGVYLLMEALPKMGIVFDVLLTDMEEQGRSTAQYFNSNKAYNWMFQFDRRGNQVVMYEYESLEHTKNLEKHGFNVGKGSFSDISFLNHLGCVGFNFGTAYYNEHTRKHYANITELDKQIIKFISFYNEFNNVKMPYNPTGQNYYNMWNMDNFGDFMECEYCGLPIDNVTDGNFVLCDFCIKNVAQCTICFDAFYKESLSDFDVCPDCWDHLMDD
jgi:hypothetical protein